MAWLALLILAAVGLRLLGLDKDIWLDEFYSILYATDADVLGRVRVVNHPPLYFIALSLWSHLGAAVPVLRLLSVGFALATLLLLARWMRSDSPRAALLAVWCAATSPLLLRYAQELRGYGLLLLCIVAAFVCAERIVAEPARWPGYLGAGISLALGVATHYVGVFVIGGLVVFVALHWNSARHVHWGKAAIAVALPVATFLWLYLVFYRPTTPLSKIWWMPGASVADAIRDVQVTVGFTDLSEFWRRRAAEIGVGSAWADLVTYAISTGFACALLFGGPWRRSLPLLGAAITYLVQLVAYSFCILPILMARTLLPLLILLVAFVGVQISGIRHTIRRRACIAYVLLAGCVFVKSWLSYGAWTPTEPWRAVAATVEANWRDGATLIIYPAYTAGPLLYYLPPSRSDATIKVPAYDPLDPIAQELSRIVRRQPPGTPLILVARHDRVVQKDPRTLQALESALRDRCGAPESSDTGSIISVSIYHTGAG